MCASVQWPQTSVDLDGNNSWTDNHDERGQKTAQKSPSSLIPTVEINVSNEPFFRFLPTVMMLVFVEEDGVSVSLVFFRSRSSWATALLPILRQTVSNAMMNIFVQRRIYSKSLHLLWCCPHNIYVLWRAWEIGRKRTSSHENDHTCLVPIYAQNQ